MAILAQKFDHFCLYLPKAVKYDTKVKVLSNKATGFYVKLIGCSILKYRNDHFNYLQNSLRLPSPLGVNYPWGGKLSQNSLVM